MIEQFFVNFLGETLAMLLFCVFGTALIVVIGLLILFYSIKIADKYIEEQND